MVFAMVERQTKLPLWVTSGPVANYRAASARSPTPDIPAEHGREPRPNLCKLAGAGGIEPSARSASTIGKKCPVSSPIPKSSPTLRAETPARQFVKFCRSSARSCNLANAARSPACAAAAATPATPDTAGPTRQARQPRTTTTASCMSLPAFSLSKRWNVARLTSAIFLVAKNEALIGRDVVRFRDISSRYRGCGCAPRQRKTQSGRTECRYGGGFGCARVLRHA
jgi:hypothetical protein